MNARTRNVVSLAVLMGALVSAPLVRAASGRALRPVGEYQPLGSPLEREGLAIEDLRRCARSDGGRYVDLGRFPALRGRAFRAD